MKRSQLVAIMGASVVTVVLVRPTEHKPPDPPEPTVADLVTKLPKEVQVLLPGGLCDNIHAAFMIEVQRLPMTPTANRDVVQERIDYYREWLRRKNCG